ncbi:MAG: hypothetical protein M1839_005187 [Geoglossum umbratile]|nr:MAG: hypothetical protein M1839_005187 [Geoglossum umbratile]
MTRRRQLWSGDIVLDSDFAPLQDIKLTVPSNCKPVNNVLLPQNAELLFLSFAAPSRIPLHLVVGGALDVWTDNEATESWFRNFFLNSTGQYGDRVESTAWWNTHTFQSDVGILLRVGDHSDKANSEVIICPKITEVLLYGAISEISSAGQLPTPPASSSPAPSAVISEGAATTTIVKQLSVHALLLSSELVYSEAQATTTGLGVEDLISLKAACRDPGVADAQFLPPLFQHTGPETQPSLKRKRTETLFEDATELARRGGKDIPQATARSGSFPPLSPQTTVSKAETQNTGPEFPVNAGGSLANFGRSSRERSVNARPSSSGSQRNWLSRPGSSHLPNVTVSKGGKEAGQIRSARRRNTLNDTRWSLLSLSCNKLTGDGEHQASQTEISEPLSLPEAQRPIELRNKELLSRIVMAGMRIYGLQQQKKPNKLRGVSEGPAAVDSHASLEIDEYKLVYHQAFKGACFAFRRHISVALLKQDCVRDVVDKLLAVYCNDPLVVSRSEGEGVAAFGQESVEKSPFAPGSVQQQCKTTGTGNVEVSTPRVRRRFADRIGGEPPPPPRIASNTSSESPLTRRNASVVDSIEAGILPHQESGKRRTI